MQLLHTREEWSKTKSGARFKPRLACNHHPGTVITTLPIELLITKRGTGCQQCAPPNRWSTVERYDELVRACAACDVRLLHTREEWPALKAHSKFKPRLECLKHPGTVITTTNITNITRKQIGCRHCHPNWNRWNTLERYDDLVRLCDERGLRLLHAREDWLALNPHGNLKPRLECIKHPGTVITTTTIHTLVSGHGAGCVQCVDVLNRWNTVERYDALALVCAERGVRLLHTREEWPAICTGIEFKPQLECLKHPGVVISTSPIQTLFHQGSFGCTQCKAMLNRWNTVERYDELARACADRGARLLHTREEWPVICTSVEFKPQLECLKHPGTVIHTTAIGSLFHQGSLGCLRCAPNHHRWNTLERYDQLTQACASVGAKLLYTREEWPALDFRNRSRPKLECLKHTGTIITTTTINDIVYSHALGCVHCYNKTEGKLLEWLQKQHPGWRWNELKLHNPKTNRLGMSVDFDNPELRLAVELDGSGFSGIGGDKAGHFYDHPDNETPHRDLEKEQQLRAAPYHYQVLRVLQPEVWFNKNGWENWLLGQFTRWAARRDAGQPPKAAIHPDAPEYNKGIYARLRGR